MMDIDPPIASSSMKKRKRTAEASSSSKERVHTVKVDIAPEPTAGSAGPVFATFPSVHPPKDTKFGFYAKPKKHQTATPDDPSFIFGSTRTVEYASVNHDARALDVGHSSQYLLGVYSKRNQTVTLHSAPLHIVTRDVIALKGVSRQSDRGLETAATSFADRRKDLSLVFGNAKQAKAVRDKERREIGAGAVGTTIDALQQGIQNATQNLPSRDEIHMAAGANRPIPPVNLNATKPEDAYPLYDTVSQLELESINIDDLILAENPNDADHRFSQRLPMKAGTKWTKNALARLGPQMGRQELQILVYIGYLIRFHWSAHFKDDRAEFEDRHPEIPSTVVDGLYSRFTEQSRSSSGAKQTPETTLKLISHVFVLCLRLEGWTMDTELIGEDFKLADKAITSHFQTLGCRTSIKKASAKAVTSASMTVDDAKPHIKAELRIPLMFPKPKVQKAAAGRR